MAKQHFIFTFRGRFGNMVGVLRNGKYHLRSLPKFVRRSDRTKLAANRFGMASHTAALIRHAIISDLDDNFDKCYINQLTKVLIPSGGRDLNSLQDFRFNRKKGIEHFFSISPALSDDGILHILPQTFPNIKGLIALEVSLIAVQLDLAGKRVIGKDVVTVMIDMHMPFVGCELVINIPGNGILLTTLQVKGITKQGNAKHIAADIIAIQEIYIEDAPTPGIYLPVYNEKVYAAGYKLACYCQRE